ncbi:MAG: GAF domain-containing protein [Gemmatimonadaceae bacterium]|nr:GAF domain-containing protein [Gloeobacterales cyanobacterium ES-bin-141]
MFEPTFASLDATRLLFDLQRASQIAQRFSGDSTPEGIARCATDGLVEQFDCAFARVWIAEPDRTALRLIASSGLYTRTDGTFARVPFGAFKVGKIAQNRVSFLSNNLADEPWVKDREWAIANNIQGFAGYPLVTQRQVIGVLAVFSHAPLTVEFQEVLLSLCTTIAIALEMALHFEHQRQSRATVAAPSLENTSLSDQLARILQGTRFALVGTERALALSLVQLFTRTAEVLRQVECLYCRLIYNSESVVLEGMIAVPTGPVDTGSWVRAAFGTLFFAASSLGGSLQTRIGAHAKVIQVQLTLPYTTAPSGLRVRIQCTWPLLQSAFTHLAQLAGLTICTTAEREVPLLTDELALVWMTNIVLWVRSGPGQVPKEAKALLDLSISPVQLREAVAATTQGQFWGMEAAVAPQTALSEREGEIVALLAQGLRDRDVARQLHISESTVKFHINNVLTKTKARTRFQALYQLLSGEGVSS